MGRLASTEGLTEIQTEILSTVRTFVRQRMPAATPPSPLPIFLSGSTRES